MKTWFHCFDISWWRHQMETFSALLPLCGGIRRSPMDSPHKGQWRNAFMGFLWKSFPFNNVIISSKIAFRKMSVEFQTLTMRCSRELRESQHNGCFVIDDHLLTKMRPHECYMFFFLVRLPCSTITMYFRYLAVNFLPKNHKTSPYHLNCDALMH